MAEREGTTPAPQRLTGVLIAASLGMFMVQIDFFALNLALPQMAADLDVSVTDLQWAISGYNIPVGALTIAALLYAVRESRDETVPRSLDWSGLLSVAAGIGLVTFAVDRGEEWGWLGATRSASSSPGWRCCTPSSRSRPARSTSSPPG